MKGAVSVPLIATVAMVLVTLPKELPTTTV